MYKAILHFFSGICHQLLLKVTKPSGSVECIETTPGNGGHDINCVLIYAFSHGSQLAFKRIYDHYAPVIYRVAQRYLASHTLAEELVVKVFSALWLDRAKFSEPEQVRLYLFTKAKSVAIALLGKALEQMLAARADK